MATGMPKYGSVQNLSPQETLRYYVTIPDKHRTLQPALRNLMRVYTKAGSKKSTDLIVKFCRITKNPKLIVNDFEMKLEREKNAIITWCCGFKEKLKCRARASSYGNTLRILNKIHNHKPDYEKLKGYDKKLLISKRFKVFDFTYRIKGRRQFFLKPLEDVLHLDKRSVIEIEDDSDLDEDKKSSLNGTKSKYKPNILQKISQKSNKISIQELAEANTSDVKKSQDQKSLKLEEVSQAEIAEDNEESKYTSFEEEMRLTTKLVLDNITESDSQHIEIVDVTQQKHD